MTLPSSLHLTIELPPQLNRNYQSLVVLQGVQTDVKTAFPMIWNLLPIEGAELDVDFGSQYSAWTAPQPAQDGQTIIPIASSQKQISPGQTYRVDADLTTDVMTQGPAPQIAFLSAQGTPNAVTVGLSLPPSDGAAPQPLFMTTLPAGNLITVMPGSRAALFFTVSSLTPGEVIDHSPYTTAATVLPSTGILQLDLQQMPPGPPGSLRVSYTDQGWLLPSTATWAQVLPATADLRALLTTAGSPTSS